MIFKRFVFLACLVFVAALMGCAAGGSEAGNPSALRGIQGQIEPGLTALSQSAVVDLCSADAILAIDSLGQQVKGSLRDDCSFHVELPVDTAYRLLVLSGDQTVAVMQFQNDMELFPAPVMVVSEDSGDIDLGAIGINEGLALPEDEPATQNDIDGDGISDFDDDDDDADGILDTDETDCDLDGIIDDFDEDPAICQNETGSHLAKIKEVFPRNGTGLTADTEPVPTDTTIMVRLNCNIWEESVTEETFRVAAPGDPVSCDYFFIGGANELECRPQQGLLPIKIYTATIQGVRCNDGRKVEIRSWNWRTAE